MQAEIIILQKGEKIKVPAPKFGEIVLKIQDGVVVQKKVTSSENMK